MGGPATHSVRACSTVRSTAAGLFALHDSDEARRSAFEHAGQCAQCRRALEQGALTWQLLGELPVPDPPAPAALQRVQQLVHGEMDREEADGLLTLLLPVVALLSFGSSLLLYRPSGGFVAGGATLGVALLLSASIQRSGWLLVSSAVGVSLLLSLMSAGAAPSAVVEGCLLIELAAGALPLLLITAAVRRWPRLDLRPGRSAAVAAAGALAAQAALHIACPAQRLGHLLAFHTGGVIVAALVGYAVGSLLRRRQRAVA